VPLWAEIEGRLSEPFDLANTDSNVRRLDNFLYGYLLTDRQDFRDRLMEEVAGIAEYGYHAAGRMPEMRAAWMSYVYNALAAELTTAERTMLEDYLESVIDSGEFGWKRTPAPTPSPWPPTPAAAPPWRCCTRDTRLPDVIDDMVAFLKNNYPR